MMRMAYCAPVVMRGGGGGGGVCCMRGKCGSIMQYREYLRAP